jgi:hypothetical protein
VAAKRGSQQIRTAQPAFGELVVPVARVKLAETGLALVGLAVTGCRTHVEHPPTTQAATVHSPPPPPQTHPQQAGPIPFAEAAEDPHGAGYVPDARIIGAVAEVTAPIGPQQQGEIVVDFHGVRRMYTATSAGGEVIAVGTQVRVEDKQGHICIVAPLMRIADKATHA